MQRPPRPRPKREREEEVLVWPDLVFVEFIAAVLFTITFLILSVFINAPLLNRANADVTPNPSKAPWYFLNLQELLLHMDKAWAGVLLPTIALVFFAVIPYIDRSREAQGDLVRHEALGTADGRRRDLCGAGKRVPGGDGRRGPEPKPGRGRGDQDGAGHPLDPVLQRG